jgi:FkbM family methyltransferase
MIPVIINELYYKILRLPVRMTPKPLFKAKYGKKYIRVPLVTYISISYSKPNWKTELIGHFVQLYSGDFIDIGANVGQTLCDFYSLTDQRRYVGFEPNPHRIPAVQEIIRRNGLEHYSVAPVGLSDQNTILSLYTASREPWEGAGQPWEGAASVVASLRPARKCDCQLVPVLRFDDIREALAISEIALMKIDVEGAERQVLEGMPETLAKIKPPIICEVLLMDGHADKANYQNNMGRLLSLLTNSNYLVFRINKTADARQVASLTPITEFPLDVWTKELAEANDYLFIPADKENQIPKAWLPLPTSSDPALGV